MLTESHLTFDDVNIIPRFSDIESRDEIDLSANLFEDVKLDIPIVSSPMDTVTEGEMAKAMFCEGGLGFIHRFMSIEDQIEQINNVSNYSHLESYIANVGAAVGVNNMEYERLRKIYCNTKCRIFLIDTAHGHHKLVKEFIEKVRGNYNVALVAGNVATRQAAFDLQCWGADAIRVGIGSGSLCSTRIQTGVGIPMISCIQNIKKPSFSSSNIGHIENHTINIPVIADGGIRTIGDCCKAIAAGADIIMLGSLLSGTKETPGRLNKEGMWPNEKLYKSYRGSASLESKQYRGEDKYVEGYSKLVPYKGKVKRIISDIKDGLRSSMSYIGARTIKEFQEKAEFIRVTQNGVRESWPHLIA